MEYYILSRRKGLTIDECIIGTEEHDRKHPDKAFFKPGMTYKEKYDFVKKTLQVLEDHGFVGHLVESDYR